MDEDATKEQTTFMSHTLGSANKDLDKIPLTINNSSYMDTSSRSP